MILLIHEQAKRSGSGRDVDLAIPVRIRNIATGFRCSEHQTVFDAGVEVVHASAEDAVT